MPEIKDNIASIKSKLPERVRLVIVTKNHSVDEIKLVYGTGHRVYGENRVQELIEKLPLLPGDIEWHFIGHLQTNKVRYIAPFAKLIHSVDSLKLLKEINKEALKNSRVIPCLLQFYIATEETKFGLSLQEARDILESPDYPSLKNISICGVMGMASLSEDKDLVRSEFRHLKSIFDQLKREYFENKEDFRDISMGMSGDWPIAVEEGATLIRIGTAIFS